jgi:hypothetical protein
MNVGALPATPDVQRRVAYGNVFYINAWWKNLCNLNGTATRTKPTFLLMELALKLQNTCGVTLLGLFGLMIHILTAKTDTKL